MEALAQVAAAFFAGGGFIAVLRLIERRKKRRVSRVIEISARINEILQALTECECTVRAIVVRLNNGGKPTVGSSLTASIVHEVSKDAGIKREFQNRPMDSDYVRGVVAAYSAGYHLEATLSAGTSLKATWEQLDVSHVLNVAIVETPTALYHLAVHYRGSPSEGCIEEAVEGAAEIAKLFKLSM